MKIKKSIQLTSKPLQELIANKYSVDFRLNQDVWRDIKVGDYLEFWEDFSGYDLNPSLNSRKVVVKVLNIFVSDSFSNLIDNLQTLGFINLENKDDSLMNFDKWWSREKQNKFGVKCFYIKLIEN